jgi:hypothetical protein
MLVAQQRDVGTVGQKGGGMKTKRILRNFKSAKNASRNVSKSKKVYGPGKSGFNATAARFHAPAGFLEIGLTGKNDVFLIFNAVLQNF